VDFVVTGVAERHQVGLFVTAAEFGGNLVMNEVSRNQATGSLAPLAERMLREILVTDLLPAVTVNLGVIGTADGRVVFSSGDGFMFRAVSALADKFGTAGISAGLQGFLRHEKAPFGVIGVAAVADCSRFL